MMNDWWFWREWPTPYRRFTTFLFGVAGLLLLSFLGLYAADIIPALGWDVISRGEWIANPLTLFDPDTHSTNLSGDFLLVQQLFRGKPLHIEAAWGYGLLALIGFLFSLGLALISSLSRLWYIVGMTAVVFLLFFFKLDLLQVPFAENRGGLVLTLVLYLPLSYYFHAIKTEVSLFVRMALFAIATVVLGVLVAQFSDPTYPLFFLSQYAVILPIFLILLFVITVAHEPIANLLYVATQSGGKQAVFHYITFTAIYLAYLFISYLHATNTLHWDIYFLDGYVVLAISSILGIWGFRQRADMAKNSLPYRPVGAWMYFLMMIGSWGSLIYFWITANDPLIETVEEVTYMAHMGFGVVFFLYTLSNFYTPMRLGKAVYRVLYKPHRMPFYVFRFMGIIASIAAGYNSSNYPITRTTAGDFNGIADAYWLEEDLTLAQAYYMEGRIFSSVNHRSNYSLASVAIENQRTQNAIQHLAKGVGKNPLPQTFVNLSLMLNDEGKFFDAKFQLEDGTATFPNSGPIANNLGLLYYNTNFLDSAGYYFADAQNSRRSVEEASTNIWSIGAKLNVKVSVDSALDLLYTGNAGQDANLLAWLGQQDQAFALPAPPPFPKDSILSQNDFGRLYNYTLLQLNQPDTAWVNDLHGYTEKLENDPWWERLTLAKAWVDFQALNFVEATKGVARLSLALPSKRGYYENLLGLMSLKIGMPNKAMVHFREAIRENHRPAPIHYVFAQLEAGQFTQARQYLSDLGSTLPSASTTRTKVNLLSEALDWNPASGKELSDQQKHWVIRYRNLYLPPATILEEWQSMGTNDFKALAGLFLWENDPELAPYVQSELSSLPVSTAALAQRIAFSLVAADPDQPDLATHSLTPITPQQKLQQRMAAIGLENGAASAETMKALAAQAPINPDLVQQVTNGLNNDGDTLGAYALIQQAVTFNQWDVELLKTYAIQCIKAGFPALGEKALDDLKLSLPAEEYNTLEAEYREIETLLTPAGFG
ncbi:MAG TPA: hypothetical protein DCP28_20360 [Cytophagales bacterium]|nr:hypothetical protein [Cytophagales bacterium]